MIEEFKANFSKEDIGDVLKLKHKYYLVEKEEKAILENIKSLECESIGIFLGEERRRHFVPSIAFLDILSKISDRKVFIDGKSSWLFLCGRDIMSRSVLRTNVTQRGLVLVQDNEDKNLGYGRIIGNLNKRNDEIVIENILDKGDYLRREMDDKKKRK